MTDYDLDDEEDTRDGPRKPGPPWTEFECPECTADNSYSDGFGPRDDVTCMVCGMPWTVRQTDSGFKLVAP